MSLLPPPLRKRRTRRKRRRKRKDEQEQEEVEPAFFLEVGGFLNIFCFEGFFFAKLASRSRFDDEEGTEEQEIDRYWID